MPLHTVRDISTRWPEIYSERATQPTIGDTHLMKPHGNLFASIKPRSPNEFVAAFVGEGTVPGGYEDFRGRAPAAKLCSSPDQAWRWVEEQAAALDLPVKWVRDIPRG